MLKERHEWLTTERKDNLLELAYLTYLTLSPISTAQGHMQTSVQQTHTCQAT